MGGGTAWIVQRKQELCSLPLLEGGLPEGRDYVPGLQAQWLLSITVNEGMCACIKAVVLDCRVWERRRNNDGDGRAEMS